MVGEERSKDRIKWIKRGTKKEEKENIGVLALFIILKRCSFFFHLFFLLFEMISVYLLPNSNFITTIVNHLKISR